LSAAASPCQMGRFETRWLAAEKNLSALAELSGQWIDRVHARCPSRAIVLDMDSSVSLTHVLARFAAARLIRTRQAVVRSTARRKP
jgi:hypothetical protein